MWDSFHPPRPGAFSEWTISAEEADARVARAMRICVANHLRQMYGEILKEPIPPRIAELLRRLDDARVPSRER